MKKILLAVCLFVAISNVQAQRILINEILPDPKPNPAPPDNEFIELFNTTGDVINLDCYTLVTYDFNGTGAVWVYDLPNITIQPFGIVVLSSAAVGQPINYKNTSYNGVNHFRWNDGSFPNQQLTKYTRSGNNLINPTIGTTIDLMPVSGGNSAALAIMLFKENGDLSNAFFTNNSGAIPAEILSLNDLNITKLSASTCVPSNNVTLHFSQIAAPTAEVLTVGSAAGASNTYYRNKDGSCGAWVKGSNVAAMSPGTKNSNTPPAPSDPAILITQQQVTCGGAQATPPEPLISRWNIGVEITNAALLPATVSIYSDNDNTQTLTALDGSSVGGGLVINANQQYNFTNLPIKKGSSVIVQVVTASGCIQVNRVFSTSCSPLPVDFKSFTATRSKSNVLVKWETSSEINNSGFAIERNTNGNWEQVAYVNSQAQGGNSTNDLSYQYIDLNNAKGISQYRIKQVDFDNKSKYTEIRSVKGDGQTGNVIVYPNPTTDGRINVVFDNAAVVRNINIIDMSGRTVKQINGISNNNITIDNLMPGIYSLRIFVPETGEQMVQKIVVNKR